MREWWTDKIGNLGRPRYGVIKTEDVQVVMPDGVRIALCIWRPDGDGEFPTLYAASPVAARRRP